MGSVETREMAKRKVTRHSRKQQMSIGLGMPAWLSMERYGNSMLDPNVLREWSERGERSKEGEPGELRAHRAPGTRAPLESQVPQ
jgi:hypothetical protein